MALDPELQFREPRVERIRHQQFLVGAGPDQMAPVDHRNAIHAFDRGLPVRDDQRGSRFHQPLQRDLHHALRLRVERGRRFIQQQDRAN